MKNNIQEVKMHQPQLVRFFNKVSAEQKINHSYIFEGLDRDDVYAFSLWIAQLVLCREKQADGSACGVCSVCRRVATLDYPDLLTIEPDGQSLKVEQIQNAKQIMMKSALEGQAKILIIRDSEKMTPSSANRLLKFIEEPEGETYIFFLTSQAGQLLTTIKSRCQQFTFVPISKKVITADLVAKQVPQSKAEIIAEVSNSLSEAVELIADEWFNDAKSNVEKWYSYLSKRDPLAFVYVQQYLVKLAKEREQQWLIFDLLIAFIKSSGQKAEVVATEIDLVLAARQKLKSNVSFQNVCEQLVWRLMNKD